MEDIPQELWYWERGSIGGYILRASRELFVTNKLHPLVAISIPDQNQRDYMLGMQIIDGERYNVIDCPDHNVLYTTTKFDAVFFLTDPRFPSYGSA